MDSALNRRMQQKLGHRSSKVFLQTNEYFIQCQILVALPARPLRVPIRFDIQNFRVGTHKRNPGSATVVVVEVVVVLSFLL